MQSSKVQRWHCVSEVPGWHSATKVQGWHSAVQNATPARRTRCFKIENFDQERVFCFGPLRQWSHKFPSRIFYPLWAPHSHKLRIGLFDHHAPKWCFWPVCDQNLGSVFLRFYYGSNFQNFDLERLRSFMPIVLKVSLQYSLPILGAPWLKITNRSFWPSWDQMVLLTGARPKSMVGVFDRYATRKGLKNLLLMAG